MILEVFKFLEVRGWESGEGGVLPDLLYLWFSSYSQKYKKIIKYFISCESWLNLSKHDGHFHYIFPLQTKFPFFFLKAMLGR